MKLAQPQKRAATRDGGDNRVINLVIYKLYPSTPLNRTKGLTEIECFHIEKPNRVGGRITGGSC